jgi:hypothetical protein
MMKRSALLAVFLVSLCQFLYSQANGSFSGTVTDKAGAVVSGATVKSTSQDTGLAREAKTDDSGHYVIPLLPVSNYTVRVESQGFQTTEQKDLRLQVNEQREVDFALNPASVSSTVEVSATEVAVQTTNATLGQVITSEQVADLPLNGRDFVQLATLTPGTTQETNPNSFFNGGPSSEVSTRLYSVEMIVPVTLSGTDGATPVPRYPAPPLVDFGRAAAPGGYHQRSGCSEPAGPLWYHRTPPDHARLDRWRRCGRPDRPGRR